MDFRDKTRDELVNDLQRLQMKVDTLEASVTKSLEDRKQIEVELRQNEVRLKVALSPIDMAVFNQDIDLRYTWMFNPQLGYITEQVIGKTDAELLPSEAAHLTTEIKRRVLEKGIGERGEVHFAFEGRMIYYDLIVEPLRNVAGQVVGITGASLNITKGKLEEARLQKSERTWSKLVTTIPDYIAIHDLEGRYIFLNHYAEGFSKKEVIGKSLYDFISEDSNEVYHKNFDACLQTKQTQRFVYTAFGNNRLLRTYDTYLVPIIENGQMVNVMAIAVDVTEQKKAEEKLKSSEAEFQSLFENSMIGISQAETGGKFTRINKAYAELYGYPDVNTMLNEVSENTKVLYVNLDDRKKVLEILERDGYMLPTEFELYRRNGEKFWALVSAKKVYDNTGKLLYLQAEHIDITDRKKLEKGMNLISIYTRNLIEASLDPLVTINSEGKITDVNLATEKITGIKRNKLIGSDFSNYFTNPEKARKGYQIVFSRGVVKDYPLTIFHTSGRKTDVLYNASLYKNEVGEVIGVFAAARDITNQKKMEEQLRKAKKSLENLTQHIEEVRENERSQIGLNLHDDLGQKLTALNLDINWLSSRIGVQSQVVKSKIEGMKQMISECFESIKEISSFLRPSILFDLGLVAAFDWQLKKFEKQFGINYQFDHVPNDIKIDDHISIILYRILQESLTNIVRHSEANKVKIELNKVKKKIELIIKDNGIGIEEEKKDSLKSMGIAGMKERIRSKGGTIFINGEKNSGTTIRVSIPI